MVAVSSYVLVGAEHEICLVFVELMLITESGV
uniref:Uncharacterized protein n=1 Tax=Arundo donax TaxID=35708 RepID=A0A0A9ADK5_ARUDO